MATRSSIGILERDGSVESVYCHSDGYPDGVGATLTQWFASEESARGLVALGDLSCVAGATALDQVRAYHRWRGEEKEPWEQVKPRRHATVAESCAFWREHGGAEYHYLWHAELGKWVRPVLGGFCEAAAGAD